LSYCFGCCLQAIEDIPQGSEAEALQLAVNCSQLAPRTVAAAQLEPAAARRLLETAVMRQHADTVWCMFQSESISQHAISDRRLCTDAFRALLVDQLHLLGREQLKAVLVQLMQSDIAHVAAVILLSVRRNKPASTRMLCRLPAAQHFSSSFVTHLLQTAVEHKAGECAAAVCTLPQARSISVSVLEQLLEAAVEGNNMEVAQHLDGLRALLAAAGISSDT
jgi:hypothetical protein